MSDSTFAAGDPIPGLSSWLLERRLGGGGFGEVWLAKHAWNEKEPLRAIKFCTHPEVRHRLVTHEKNVVLRVMRHAGDHPNIVPLIECNLDGETPWLMYEYVEGGTLAERIERWRELPVSKRVGRAVRTLYAVAGALARCHQLSPPLVHRDLKPANVLMAEGKVPRIIDFGIGGVVLPKAANGSTALGARVPTMMHGSGTRLYAPPEQLLGAQPNPREDVYALGVMAYQMIVGGLTVGPGSDAADELRDLKVPAELATLIARSVALNTDRRPADATEWEAVLGVLLQRVYKPGADSATEISAVPPSGETAGARPWLTPTEISRMADRGESASALRRSRLLILAAVVGIAALVGCIVAFAR